MLEKDKMKELLELQTELRNSEESESEPTLAHESQFQEPQLNYRGKDPGLVHAFRKRQASPALFFTDFTFKTADAREKPAYLRDEPPPQAKTFPAYPKITPCIAESIAVKTREALNVAYQITEGLNVAHHMKDTFKTAYQKMTDLISAFKASSKIINEFYESLPTENKKIIQTMAKQVGGYSIGKLVISVFSFSSPIHLVLFSILMNVGTAKAFSFGFGGNGNPFQIVEGIPENGVDLCKKVSSLVTSCQQFYAKHKDGQFFQAVAKHVITEFGKCTNTSAIESMRGCTPWIKKIQEEVGNYLNSNNPNINDDLMKNARSIIYSAPFGNDCSIAPSTFKAIKDSRAFNALNSISTIYSNPFNKGYGEELTASTFHIKTTFQLFGVSPSSSLARELTKVFEKKREIVQGISCWDIFPQPDATVPLALLGGFAIIMLGVFGCLARHHHLEEKKKKAEKLASDQDAFQKLIMKEIEELAPDFSLTVSSEGSAKRDEGREGKNTKKIVKMAKRGMDSKESQDEMSQEKLGEDGLCQEEIKEISDRILEEQQKRIIDNKYQKIINRISDAKILTPKLAKELTLKAKLAYYSWDSGTDASLDQDKRIKELKEILQKLSSDIYIDIRIKKDFLSLIRRICIDRAGVYHLSDFNKALEYYFCAYTCAMHRGDDQAAAEALDLAFRSERYIRRSGKYILEENLNLSQLLRELFIKGRSNFDRLVKAYEQHSKEMGIEASTDPVNSLSNQVETQQYERTDGLHDSKESGSLDDSESPRARASQTLDDSKRRTGAGFLVLQTNRSVADLNDSDEPASGSTPRLRASSMGGRAHWE